MYNHTDCESSTTSNLYKRHQRLGQILEDQILEDFCISELFIDFNFYSYNYKYKSMGRKTKVQYVYACLHVGLLNVSGRPHLTPLSFRATNQSYLANE